MLLMTAAVLVQSASHIEVDEDGNEYEVKKFHIQGRQLSDKNQRCVITRRRRSTEEGRQYGNADPIVTLTAGEDVDKNDNKKEETDVKDEMDNMDAVEDPTVYQKPPVMIVKDEFEDEQEESVKPAVEDEKETEQEEAAMPAKEQKQKPKKKKEKLQKVTIIRPHKTEEMEDNEEEDKEEHVQTQKKKKEKLQKVTLIRPQAADEMQEQQENEEEEEDTEEHALLQGLQFVEAPLVSNAGGNSYVIVQTHPPAQQKPAPSAELSVLPTDADYGVQNGVLPISWSYENQPISTTAVWSTGDDVPNDIFNQIKNSHQTDFGSISEYDEEEELPMRPTRPRPQKQKIRNQNQNKKKPNRRRPNRKNQNKPQPVKKIVRRRYHNDAANQNENKNKRRRVTNRPKETQTSRGQGNKKKQNKNKEIPLAITSETLITTIDDAPEIECIIINKEPSTTSTTSTTTTTTTRRPFWNILGRQASVEQPRDYGLRKRTSLRFVA